MVWDGVWGSSVGFFGGVKDFFTEVEWGWWWGLVSLLFWKMGLEEIGGEWDLGILFGVDLSRRVIFLGVRVEGTVWVFRVGACLAGVWWLGFGFSVVCSWVLFSFLILFVKMSIRDRFWTFLILILEIFRNLSISVYCIL